MAARDAQARVPRHPTPRRPPQARRALDRRAARHQPLKRSARAARSAGVTDMRFGSVLDEHWQGCDRFAQAPDPRDRLKLPDDVECDAIAATTAAAAAASLPSDGLVPVLSALEKHEKPALTLAFPEPHKWIAYAMNHLDLLGLAEVYGTIWAWLSA